MGTGAISTGIVFTGIACIAWPCGAAGGLAHPLKAATTKRGRIAALRANVLNGTLNKNG